MAIYTYIYRKKVPKRCTRPLYNTYTPKKLVCTTPRLHSYCKEPPNFYTGSYSASLATLAHCNKIKYISIQMTNQA